MVAAYDEEEKTFEDCKMSKRLWKALLQADECDHHSPEKIIEILHSITGISRDNAGGVDFTFDGGQSPEVANGFIPGSFTRKLLELIEEHLKEQS